MLKSVFEKIDVILDIRWHILLFSTLIYFFVIANLLHYSDANRIVKLTPTPLLLLLFLVTFIIYLVHQGIVFPL